MPAGRDDMLEKTAVWVCGGAASLSCAGYRHDRRTVRGVQRALPGAAAAASHPLNRIQKTQDPGRHGRPERRESDEPEDRPVQRVGQRGRGARVRRLHAGGRLVRVLFCVHVHRAELRRDDVRVCARRAARAPDGTGAMMAF